MGLLTHPQTPVQTAIVRALWAQVARPRRTRTHTQGYATPMPFRRAPGPVYSSPDPVDLTDTSTRYTCPECGEPIQRLPTGRMRYHGATRDRGRRCLFPEREGALLGTIADLASAMQQWPVFAEVYLAIQRAIQARPAPKPHGGQIRRPDPDGWRWRKGGGGPGRA